MPTTEQTAEADAGQTSAVTADVLWRSLQRFDFYASSTSGRAPVVMTFNTFVVGAIILKWREVVGQLEPVHAATVAAGVLLAIIACASLVSLAFLFRVIAPYRPPRSSSAAPGPSLFFFEHVASYRSPRELLEAADRYDDRLLRADLAAQAHALASSVHDKFRSLRYATAAIRFAQLPALAILVLLKLALTL